MIKHILQFLSVACLATTVLWAANDPFVGEWKLDPSKSSKLTEKMKVESIAGNKYAFDFGGGLETIAADGTDQPGGFGTTLSATIQAPDSWKIVRKKDGHMLLTAYWKLSSDGNTLTDDYTEFAPNGSSSNVKYVFKRTAGTSGFVGTWESSGMMRSAFVIKLQPYEGDGLSIIAERITKNVKFDGRDYPNVGANVPSGLMSSARRVNEHTVELTEKLDGKVTSTQEITLSSDGKTLTITAHPAGQTAPNILVFERQ